MTKKPKTQTPLSQEKLKDRLIQEKGMSGNDVHLLMKMLDSSTYSFVFGNYGKPFRDKKTGKYINTLPGDVAALYELDERLRPMLLFYLIKIEKKAKEIVSRSFCEKYGDNQKEYLDPKNYTADPNLVSEVKKIIRFLRNIAYNNIDKPKIVEHRKKHHNVPLWLVMDVITLGQLSRFYDVLTIEVKNKISKKLQGIGAKDIGQCLKCITMFRNECAHGNVVYSYRLDYRFPDTHLHKNLGIKKRGHQYVCGKNDLFGLVIALRYFLSDDDFRDFISELKSLLNDYFSKSQRLADGELFDYMGFPPNWEDVLTAPKLKVTL